VINSIVSIFWGLWLLPMGYLVFKSGFMSKIPGVLLIVAGSGYLVDTFARILAPDYGATMIATVIMATMFGEMVFPIWLLIKGVNVETWKKRALEQDQRPLSCR
jgi:ascorbate-specific PTS system EIIC-type component UlaA